MVLMARVVPYVGAGLDAGRIDGAFVTEEVGRELHLMPGLDPGRTSASVNMFSPASENVPMINTRIIQTMTATKTGTTFTSVDSPIKILPAELW